MPLPATLVFTPEASKLIAAMEALPVKVVCVRARVVHPTAPDNFFCVALRAPDQVMACEWLGLVQRELGSGLLADAVMMEADDDDHLVVFPHMRGAEPVRN